MLSTWAGAKGGLGALSLAKRARQPLEAALKLDPAALDGSAYTSLGTLYSKVPGFPAGFGDDDKAEQLLKSALQPRVHDRSARFTASSLLVISESSANLRRTSSASP